MAPIHLLLKKMASEKASTTWDDQVRGLGVRINRDGSTVWCVKYSLDGKQVMKTLGDTDFMTTDQARQLVTRIKVLARNGTDPAAILSSHVSAGGISRSAGVTFAEFCSIYMEKHARELKKSWKKDLQRIERYMLPAWRDRRLTEIKRSDVMELHQKLGKKIKTTANRVREQLSKMFKCAILWGFLPDGYPNPAWGVQDYKEKPRARWVNPSEMTRLATAINNHPDKLYRVAIKLLLYTGLRSDELKKLKWKQLDLDSGTLTLIDTKANDGHFLPLADPAIKLFESIKQDKSVYVFPGKSRGNPISRFDKHWHQIRKEAGLEDVTLHDLRRTAGSWIVQRTKNVAIVGDVLNQTHEHITRVYARFANDDVKNAVTIYGDSLSGFLEA